MALLLKANTILSQCILAVNNAVHNLKRAIQLHFTFKWIIVIPYISGLSFKKLNFPSKSRNFPLPWASKNIKTPARLPVLFLSFRKEKEERERRTRKPTAPTPHREGRRCMPTYIYIYILTQPHAQIHIHARSHNAALSAPAPRRRRRGHRATTVIDFPNARSLRDLWGFLSLPRTLCTLPSPPPPPTSLLLLLLVHPRLHFGGGSSGAPDYEPPPRCEQALLVRGGPANIAPAGGHLRRALASIIQLDACRSIVE